MHNACVAYKIQLSSAVGRECCVVVVAAVVAFVALAKFAA